MTSIDVKIEDKELQEALRNLRSKISNLSPFYKKAAILMKADILRHFQSEEGPKGSWEKLTKTYEKRKLLKGKNHILQFSGRLRGSIDAKDMSDNASVGTNIQYGTTHQFGKGRIPARPFLWLSTDALEKIMNVMKEHIKD